MTNNNTNRRATEKVIKYVYWIVFLLLLLSYFISLFANRQLVRQANWVEHTNNVINHVSDILAKVKDAETGARGYIITKKIEFLSPYLGSYEKTITHYNAALELTKDDPLQQERLQKLKKNIDRRFEQIAFVIRSFNDNNRQVTDSMEKRQPEALKVMEEIRSAIAVIEREERIMLSQRNIRMKNIFRTINAITIISLTLAFCLSLFGFITFTRISNDRKRYQEELNSRIEELKTANEELVKMRSLEKFAVSGRIARTIGHEVRNPLTNIMLASSELKSAIAEKEENTEYLFEMISRNSDRINQLISDLLDSTKISDLKYERISVNKILEDAIKEAEDRIVLSNVKVIKKYSSDICDLSVDTEKIKIAFLNIIINALEAMENKDGSVLTLETKGGDKCTVIISDNGTGMDQESVSRLFEPYFTSKSKGNGLGLTNTQNIVLAHKGEISVESTKGRGTSFIIKLDLAG